MEWCRHVAVAILGCISLAYFGSGVWKLVQEIRYCLKKKKEQGRYLRKGGKYN